MYDASQHALYCYFCGAVAGARHWQADGGRGSHHLPCTALLLLLLLLLLALMSGPHQLTVHHPD
jgi:hypothetical protein